MSARERRVLVLAVAWAAAALPAIAGADRLEATATTVLLGRPDPQNGEVHTVVSALQLLELEAKELGNPVAERLSVTFSGWTGAALGEPARGQRAVGDIDLFYVHGGLWRERAQVRLGRQLVVGGAARVLQLDGARVEVRPLRGLGLLVYGGAPVRPELEWRRGDTVIGGRASYRHTLALELGVSLQRRQERSRMAGEDLAFDQRYRPFDALWLTGFQSVSLAEGRLAEADLRATMVPAEGLEVALGFRRTAPDLFLSRASVLSVFATGARDEAGGGVFVRAGRFLELQTSAYLSDSGAGAGHHLSLRGDAFPTRRELGRGGLELVRIASADDATTFVRVFGRLGLGPAWQATTSVDYAHAEQPRNGVRGAATGLVALGWDLAPSWHLAGSALAGVTPALEQRYETMLRLTYQRTRRHVLERP